MGLLMLDTIYHESHNPPPSNPFTKDQPLRPTPSHKSYLVVEGGMHSRESLMALLWPESPSKNAAATLRATL